MELFDNNLVSETPVVGEGVYSPFPHNEWGWFEFFAGILLGGYTTVNARAKGGDCQSRTFNFVMSVHAYSKLFNVEWSLINTAVNYTKLILKIIIDGYSAYGMQAMCRYQLGWSTKNTWVEEFRVKGRVGQNQKATDKELEIIQESENSNGDNPATWDEDSLNLEWNNFQATEEEKLEEETTKGVTLDQDYEEGRVERLNILKVVMYAVGIINDCIGIEGNLKTNYYYYFLGKAISGVAAKTFVLTDYLLHSNIIVPTEAWVRYRYGEYYKPKPFDCGKCSEEADDFEECQAKWKQCMMNVKAHHTPLDQKDNAAKFEEKLILDLSHDGAEFF